MRKKLSPQIYTFTFNNVREKAKNNNKTVGNSISAKSVLNRTRLWLIYRQDALVLHENTC